MIKTDKEIREYCKELFKNIQVSSEMKKSYRMIFKAGVRWVEESINLDKKDGK